VLTLLGGERFVLRLLRRRFPKSLGYVVTHVAAANPGCDHDIAVRLGKRLVQVVEVETRVGSPDDQVMISENELRCRQLHKGKHSIFIVYLGAKKAVSAVLEIGATDAFVLSPRQHWLHPAIA